MVVGLTEWKRTKLTLLVLPGLKLNIGYVTRTFFANFTVTFTGLQVKSVRLVFGHFVGVLTIQH